jgi:heme exporter protein D
MPGFIAHSAAVESILIALAAILVILLALVLYRVWQRSRITPEERERRRCARLVTIGKITDATLVEVRENLVFYCYDVRGVEYTASQDLSRFAGDAAIDFSGISAMSVKYDARNPANSIIVSEEWNGLRGASRLLPKDHASH